MRTLGYSLVFIFALNNCLGQVIVGCKNFSESRLLGEILAQQISLETNLVVERKFNLGGTIICFEALKQGEIDLYVEYTGTGYQSILGENDALNSEETFEHVKTAFKQQHNLTWLPPLGFNNTYALAVAMNSPLSKISDLANQKEDFRMGFSHEFLKRADGYPGLKKHYHLPEFNPVGMEHALTYNALVTNEIALTDAYITDGSLKKFEIKLLEDDKNFFPPYEAAPLVSLNTLEKYPALQEALQKLSHTINDSTMQALNYQVEVLHQPIEKVASDFLSGTRSFPSRAKKREVEWWIIGRKTLEHLLLVIIAVAIASAIAILLGLFTFDRALLSKAVLQLTNLLQTIPSLALLALLIPFAGIGYAPALVALIIYSILPVLRNTVTGLNQIPHDILLSAEALGMSRSQVLWKIRFPLAFPMILAGVRTSTTWSIGTATVAAFIGAGGLGDLIFTGITNYDIYLILQGAIPTAALALIMDALFGITLKKNQPN